jgi:hypothetical protein
MRVFFPVVRVSKRNSVLKALVVDSFGQPSSLILQCQARPTQYPTPGQLALLWLEPGNCVTARDLFDFIQLSYLCSRNSGLRTCPIEDLTLLMEDLYQTMCCHEIREWEMVASQLQRLPPQAGDESSASEGNERLFSSILMATRLQMEEELQMIWDFRQVLVATTTPEGQCSFARPEESPFPPSTPNWPDQEPWTEDNYSVDIPNPIPHYLPAPAATISSDQDEHASTRLQEPPFPPPTPSWPYQEPWTEDNYSVDIPNPIPHYLPAPAATISSDQDEHASTRLQEPLFPPSTPSWPYQEPWTDNNYSVNIPDTIPHNSPAPSDKFRRPLVTLAPYPSIRVCPEISLYA